MISSLFFLCSTKKLCVVTIESDISLSVRNMSCFDLWLTFGSILAQTLFISPPTHTYARTDTVPPNPLPYPPYSAQSPFIWLFNSFGVDSSYPKIHRFSEENMWSIWRRIHRTPSKVYHEQHLKNCAERPNRHRRNGREKVRCASFCTRASFAHLWLNGWLFCAQIPVSGGPPSLHQFLSWCLPAIFFLRQGPDLLQSIRVAKGTYNESWCHYIVEDVCIGMIFKGILKLYIYIYICRHWAKRLGRKTAEFLEFLLHCSGGGRVGDSGEPPEFAAFGFGKHLGQRIYRCIWEDTPVGGCQLGRRAGPDCWRHQSVWAHRKPQGVETKCHFGGRRCRSLSKDTTSWRIMSEECLASEWWFASWNWGSRRKFAETDNNKFKDVRHILWWPAQRSARVALRRYARVWHSAQCLQWCKTFAQIDSGRHRRCG